MPTDEIKMTAVKYILPEDLLAAIDAARGSKSRLQWMREVHAKAAKFKLPQLLGRGQYERNKG